MERVDGCSLAEPEDNWIKPLSGTTNRGEELRPGISQQVHNKRTPLEVPIGV